MLTEHGFFEKPRALVSYEFMSLKQPITKFFSLKSLFNFSHYSLRIWNFHCRSTIYITRYITLELLCIFFPIDLRTSSRDTKDREGREGMFGRRDRRSRWVDVGAAPILIVYISSNTAYKYSAIAITRPAKPVDVMRRKGGRCWKSLSALLAPSAFPVDRYHCLALVACKDRARADLI